MQEVLTFALRRRVLPHRDDQKILGGSDDVSELPCLPEMSHGAEVTAVAMLARRLWCRRLDVEKVEP